MNTASYIAELLVWSTAQFMWQATLACTVFSVWRARWNPTPEQRHAVAIGILITLPILVIATAGATHASLLSNAREGPSGALGTHSNASLGHVSAAFELAVAALPALITIWCLGATLGLMRVAREHRQLRSVRRRLRAPVLEVAARVGYLATRAGVAHDPVVLAGDAASGGPFVGGMTLPFLVLPSVELTTEEWNAVIFHELAHIRRRDYAVNYAVQVLSALLWFHPSVRLLARWAAAAREECCDADAARLSAAPLALARAIVRIAEHQTHDLRAVAATSGSLVTRVQLLLAFNEAKSRKRSGIVIPLLAGSAVCVSGIAVCCAAAPSIDRLVLTGALADALPTQRTLIEAVDPAGRFTLALINGRVANVAIGGVSVDRRALRVEDDRLTVTSATAKPVLSLDFDPRGAISWHARRP